MSGAELTDASEETGLEFTCNKGLLIERCQTKSRVVSSLRIAEKPWLIM